MDFVRIMRNCSCHLIATIQTKEAYHMSTAGNKKEVQKIGLEPLQQDGIEYLFNTTLALDMKHRAKPMKDRTSFFENAGTAIITEEIAALYARWCGEADHTSVPLQVQEKINGCNSLQELLELLLHFEVTNVATLQAFIKRKQVLAEPLVNKIINQQIINNNGTNDYSSNSIARMACPLQ